MSALPKLDAEKFAKVLRLANEGATDGERKAARARAEAMAQRAGMTFDQAVSNLDTQHKVERPAPFSIFEEFFNSPEMRAQRAQKERQQAELRKELLAEYGSESAIFARTEREWALFNAVKDFSQIGQWENGDGTVHPFAESIDGARFFYPSVDELTPRTVRAVSDAYALPGSVHGALVEYLEWKHLQERRDPFSGGDWQHYHEVEARIAVLRDILDNRPAASWEDMDARIVWWELDIQRDGMSPTREEREARKNRIKADMDILRQLPTGSEPQNSPAHFGRMTNAEKAKAVKALLHTSPELSDRELGRRAGVSPQTVCNWRSRLGMRQAA